MAELSPERALFATRGTSSAAFPASCGALATPTRAHLSRRRDKVKDLVAFRSRAGHGTGSDRGVGDLFDDRQRPIRGLRQAPSCQLKRSWRNISAGLCTCGNCATGIVVSGRTLRLCCAEFLGMGPTQYVLLRQLSEVRLALRDAHPDKVKVTEVAHRFGFTELGALRGDISGDIWRGPIDHSPTYPGSAPHRRVKFFQFLHSRRRNRRFSLASGDRASPAPHEPIRAIVRTLSQRGPDETVMHVGDISPRDFGLHPATIAANDVPGPAGCSLAGRDIGARIAQQHNHSL